VKLPAHPRQLPNFRICGAPPLLPHAPSLLGQGQFQTCAIITTNTFIILHHIICNTVLSESRCALIKGVPQLKEPYRVLHFNRCLTTEYNETTAQFNGNFDTDNQIYVPWPKCTETSRTRCVTDKLRHTNIFDTNARKPVTARTESSYRARS
jgi:hypothetical protein